MPTISVVIPAYNAGKYISLALDSLIDQTFQDWECIVVNDGSTDNTLAVIQEYASREPRIKYKSIENSGSAKVPRDTAIKTAKSEWILALDADDTLGHNTIAKLLERQQETNADIVLLRLVITDNHGIPKNSSVPNNDFEFKQVLDGKDAAKLTIGKWVINGNGLISKRIFDLRKPIYNYMNADEYDTRQMLILANRVAFIDTPYYYRDNESSITRKISIKLFDSIHTNRLLYDLIVDTFGQESQTSKIMNEHRFLDIVNKQILLKKQKKTFSEEQCVHLNQLIKKNFLDIHNRKKVYNNNLLKKILLTSNYFTFYMATSLIVYLKVR